MEINYPVAAAAALSVVNRLTDDFLANVRKKSELLRGLLQDAPGIEALSGLGLMVGIRTTRSASDVVADCMQNGVPGTRWQSNFFGTPSQPSTPGKRTARSG